MYKKFIKVKVFLIIVATSYSLVNGQKKFEGEDMAKKDIYKGSPHSKEAISDKLKPNIDITQENRLQLSIMLNRLLADAYILAVKTKNYHWAVYGPTFSELHKFFDEQSKLLEMNIDLLAERVRALGFRAIGTLKEFMEYSQLKESTDIPEPMQMIKNLLHDHELVIRTLRVNIDQSYDDYGDMGTNNFLTGLMEKHEKTAWMLRSFLEKK